jgi:hypothetical protein
MEWAPSVGWGCCGVNKGRIQDIPGFSAPPSALRRIAQEAGNFSKHWKFQWLEVIKCSFSKGWNFLRRL